MIEPLDRKSGNTPSRQELADKLNEVILELEAMREAIGALLSMITIEDESLDGKVN